MKKQIFYGKHTINNKDIDAVVRVLKKNNLTQGKEVNLFEKKLSDKFKAKFCTVVANGTAALFLVGKLLKFNKEDTVLTTPLSFLASSNCIELNGAKTQFIDIDQKTYTIDPNRVEYFLKKNKKKIKALIGVDYAGHPCDWKSLKYLANKYGFFLINDGCHSIGSKINSDTGYALKYADLLTHSYHPVKAITTGEGGSILSNNGIWDKELKKLRNHSIERYKNNDPWIYKIEEPGFNFRITDIQCSLGISQLKNLDFFIKQRRKIAKLYNNEFSNIKEFTLPTEKIGFYHSYHLYPLQINFSKINISKNFFFKKMKSFGINLQVHYIPIYLQPYFKKKYKFKNNSFLNTYNFYKNEVSLPIYPSLTYKNVYFLCKKIISLIK